MFTQIDLERAAGSTAIKISEGECESIITDINNSLDYIDSLISAIEINCAKELECASEFERADLYGGIREFKQQNAISGENLLREDDVAEGLSRVEALSNASESDGKFFLVPNVLD